MVCNRLLDAGNISNYAVLFLRIFDDATNGTETTKLSSETGNFTTEVINILNVTKSLVKQNWVDSVGFLRMREIAEEVVECLAEVVEEEIVGIVAFVRHLGWFVVW
jgi:hypothetical protein